MSAVPMSEVISHMQRLLAIPSPTGFTQEVSQHLMDTLAGYGLHPVRARKGTVICPLGGEGEHAVLAAHVDTLGLMVRALGDNGRPRFARLGSPSYNAVETEQVTLHTRDGRQYTGVVQLQNASMHVNGEQAATARNQDTMEILLDELVEDKAGLEALGIAVGDVISLDPRTVVTPSGFIRSRFLDDKLSAAMLLALAKGVADGGVTLRRRVTLMFTVYEEVGHGASHGVPADAVDMLVVDMGCVGEGLTCTETMVSICAKDSSGPFDYALTSELIQLAKDNGLAYAVDIYPSYASDAATAREAGADLRCALIGAGVYASHGYERTHVRGVENTMKLILTYAAK